MQEQLISKSTVTLCNQSILEITLVRICYNASGNYPPPLLIILSSKTVFNLMGHHILMVNLTSKSFFVVTRVNVCKHKP